MKIRNKYWVLVLSLLSVTGLFAQGIEKCYLALPEVLSPTLNGKQRLELLEYHKAGQGDSILNKFGNSAYLQVFDTLSNRIVVRSTPSSTLEVKVFVIDKNNAFIGVIHTVCGKVCQSEVAFYDTVWNKLPITFIFPKAIEWVNSEKLAVANLDVAWVKNVFENTFVSLSFDAKDEKIIVRNNSLDFLSDKDRKLLSPLVDDKVLSYSFVGGKWVRL